MPTYEITAPNGKTYQIPGPEGATDEQVRAQVLQQFPDAGATAPSTPAAPMEREPWEQIPSLADVGSTINAGLKSASGFMGKAINNAFTGISGAPQGSLDAPVSPGTILNPVPENMAGAGRDAGLLALGPFGRLARMLGAGGGAAVGSAVSGNDPSAIAKDAGIAGATAGAVEGGSALLSKILRSVPNNPLAGGKRNIAEGDAANYGRVMGEQSPPLAGAATAQDLRTLAAGPGQAELGSVKEAATQFIEQRIGTGPVLPMPSLGGTPMNLREANARLSEIGARAFSKNPVDRTYNGIDQRQLYGEIARDIDGGLQALDPQAAALFREVQGVYQRGMTMIRPLQRDSTFRMEPSGPQFNTPAIQKNIGSPKGEAAYRRGLGDQGFEDLQGTMLRGAEPGSMDRLAAGSGGMFDAFMDFLRHPTGLGTVVSLAPRMALPNVGSQYAGRAPYTVDPAVQTLIDLGILRASDVMRSGQTIPIGPPPTR